jgi:hypothetical protein
MINLQTDRFKLTQRSQPSCLKTMMSSTWAWHALFDRLSSWLIFFRLRCSQGSDSVQVSNNPRDRDAHWPSTQPHYPSIRRTTTPLFNFKHGLLIAQTPGLTSDLFKWPPVQRWSEVRTEAAWELIRNIRTTPVAKIRTQGIFQKWEKRPSTAALGLVADEMTLLR